MKGRMISLLLGQEEYKKINMEDYFLKARHGHVKNIINEPNIFADY